MDLNTQKSMNGVTLSQIADNIKRTSSDGCECLMPLCSPMGPWTSSWRTDHCTKSLLFLQHFLWPSCSCVWLFSFFLQILLISMTRSCRTRLEVRGSSKLVCVLKESCPWYGLWWWLVTWETGAKEELGGRRGGDGSFMLVYLQKRRDGRNRNQHWGECGSELCWDATGNTEKPAELLWKRKYPGWYLMMQLVSTRKTELGVLTSHCSCPKDLHIQHNFLFILILRHSPRSSQGLCPSPALPSLSSNFPSSTLSKASALRALLKEPSRSLALKSLYLPLPCQPLLEGDW